MKYLSTAQRISIMIALIRNHTTEPASKYWHKKPPSPFVPACWPSYRAGEYICPQTPYGSSFPPWRTDSVSCSKQRWRAARLALCHRWRAYACIRRARCRSAAAPCCAPATNLIRCDVRQRHHHRAQIYPLTPEWHCRWRRAILQSKSMRLPPAVAFALSIASGQRLHRSAR